MKSKTPFRETRQAELKELMYFYKKISEEYKPDIELISGDFNDVPESSIFEEADLNKNFTNAYFEALGKHPEFTSYKFREGKLQAKCIDYIFF